MRPMLVPTLRGSVLRLVLAAAAATLVACLLPALALAGSSSERVYFPSDCEREAIKPRSIVVACGDGNFAIRSIRWSRWNAGGATGKGTARVNTCEPNCAEGRFVSYPNVTVVLSRPLLCRAVGFRQFRRLSYRFNDRRPPGFRRSGSQGFGCPTQAG